MRTLRKRSNRIPGMRVCGRCGRAYPPHAMVCQNCHPLAGGGGAVGVPAPVPGFDIGNLFFDDVTAREFLIVDTRKVESGLRLAVVDMHKKGGGVHFFTVAPQNVARTGAA